MSQSPPDDFTPRPPGWLALADQFDAAIAHARRVAVRMVETSGGHLVGGGGGPWANALFLTVTSGRHMVCRHLYAGPAVVPHYICAPRVLGCWSCFRRALAVRETLPPRCEACGRPGQTPGVLVVQRDLLVGVGELCQRCVAAEIDI